ncbi:aldo/keto reductase [Lacticaseibacillus porcinae]|uniref:aldo/keto reductase n=1 Tax=Lacticaseibacillus porcinae TaxID=1123687 RepID=UPI000F7AC58E|nr:aldo/keto reductase [Lacticaseibacillus porcinae]
MYEAKATRYDHLAVRSVGNSGLRLPAVSLGLWQRFDAQAPFDERQALLLHAFDAGVFHFDVADHYGIPYGSSEALLGKVLAKELKGYRDELVIATKVGFTIGAGPYGDGLSRKAIMQHIDGSLQRLQTDYVDVYYAHRFDETVPLEETASALDTVVKSGKARYIGISNYNVEQTQAVLALFETYHTPVVVSQMSYNMFNRSVETSGLLDVLQKHHQGLVAYGPLSEGLLSDRYLNGLPPDFKIHHTNQATLSVGADALVEKLNALNAIAQNRGQSLSQLALAWLLRDPVVASVIIGTTSAAHLDDNLQAAQNTTFTADELAAIDQIVTL